ncbi:MAG: ATP-binding protein, partial [Desulfofundulus sp.]
MEPVLLDLQNFLSYKRETVDLSPITCAALTGENGAGKSSLLDAITWALFGQGTRGGTKELDNYVTRG